MTEKKVVLGHVKKKNSGLAVGFFPEPFNVPPWFTLIF